MEIKERLRQLRDEKGRNQIEVAESIKVSRASYSSYENGITPPMQTCVEIAKYFNVSLDYLLGLSNERKPAGGALAVSLEKIAAVVGDHAPSASDLNDLIIAALKYYRKGAPCGDVPLHAFRDFITNLRAAFLAATANDYTDTLDAVNAAVIAALELSKMPAALHKSLINAD